MRRHGIVKAYTIVELVMVIAIIGIVAGLAMPRFSSAVNSNRADVAARRVAADLAMLRLAARASSTSTTVTFSTTDNTYAMTGVSRTTGATQTVSLSSFPYYCKVSLASGTTASLTYNQYGVPTANLTVYLDCGKFRRTVTVDTTSGTPTLSATVTVLGTSVSVGGS